MEDRDMGGAGPEDAGSLVARRPPGQLTRRAVLLAGAGALAGAAVGSRPLSAAALGTRRATLMPLGADVWASTVEVQGTPADAELTVAGREVRRTASGMGFKASISLQPGANAVVARGPQGGSSASATYTARLADRPVARASVTIEGAGVRLEASGSQSDPYSSAPIESVTWRRRDGTPLGSGVVLELTGPWSDGEQYVLATVTDAARRTDQTTVVFGVSEGRPEALDLRSWQPSWVQSAIVYGVVPPLFGTAPLQAVTAALDRLAALGVSVLWLSPIFATLPGEFGYAVIDHFSVRPDYGSLEDLQALVAAAHARGLRVILDLPLNDTSDQHPYFQQARSARERSHYWDYYERDGRGRPKHYFNWTHLPNLEYDNTEVRALATEAAAYWLRVADVDGFRCDAAWAVEERRPGFWAQWCAELQRIRPDLLLLAETSDREGWAAGAGFAAAYDWTEKLGEWAWSKVFGPGTASTSRLRAALQAPSATRPFRFIENNDTGARFITRYGAPMSRAAAALLLSLPGIPCIYTGQEIGAEYEPYQELAPLDWGRDPQQLEALYRSLTEARAALPLLATGSLTPIRVAPSEKVLAYVLNGSGASLLVAVNFSAGEVSAVVRAHATKSTLRVPAFSSVTTPLD